MSVLITILVAIALLVGIILLIAAFTKKDYSLYREIIISRPVADVFDYVKYLKNQDKYSRWAMLDPNMKRDFKGVDGTPGFVAYWDSPVKEAGKGEQEITAIREGSEVDYEIRFIRPFSGKADSYLKTDPAANSTCKVTWGFSSKMTYPMNFMLLFLNMEKLVGKDLETGLSNLKNILEK